MQWATGFIAEMIKATGIIWPTRSAVVENETEISVLRTSVAAARGRGLVSG